MSLSTWLAEYYPVPADQVPESEAVAHSLRKWEGLRKENLGRHGVKVFNEGDIHDGDVTFSINGSTCALCKRFRDDPGEERICHKCPIVEATGDKCGGAFDIWCDDADPEPMIAALRACEVKDASGTRNGSSWRLS